MSAKTPCKYGDAACPCQDGDTCHYEGENPWPAPDPAGVTKEGVDFHRQTEEPPC